MENDDIDYSDIDDNVYNKNVGDNYNKDNNHYNFYDYYF